MVEKASKVEPHQVVLDLIARFEAHIDVYRAGRYKEAQFRRDFLGPFWKTLGSVTS
jgi:hypothetical protein